MTNAELIAELRGHIREVPLTLLRDAADALEAAEHRIEDLEGALAACRARKDGRMPKEGEWIEDDTTYCGADLSNYKCSLCGKIGGTWRRGLKQDELPPFCGSCGAKMKTMTDCHTL